jgi:hypothetical protein
MATFRRGRNAATLISGRSYRRNSGKITGFPISTWFARTRPSSLSRKQAEFMTSKRAVDAHQWPSAHRSSGDQRARASRVSSPSPSSVDELTCPICKTTAKPLDKLGDAEGFECLAHDRFRVSESVLAVPALRNSPGRRWEDALRRARARQPGETAPTIMTYDFD